MKKYSKALLVLLFLVTSNHIFSQNNDSIQIINTCRDYFEGWYTADTLRMNRALHEKLIKRRITIDSIGNYKISEVNKSVMMEKTASHKVMLIAEQGIIFKILDIYGNASSVRAESKGFVDYIHLGKYENRWQVINVLWEKKPKK